jgi:hypothetical protein
VGSVISSSRAPATVQLAVLLLAFLIILSGCETMPPKGIEVSPSSSVLGVDVSFTVDLFHPSWAPNWQRHLGTVLFIKEPPSGGLQGVTEIVAASWIRKTRAYLLNPEPGTYYVAGASLVTDMPMQRFPVVDGGGVSVDVSTGGSFGHTVILTKEMIQQTKTTIVPSGVEFMGAIRLAPGDRVNAKAEFQDDLQEQLAEVIRPGSTSATGLSGNWTMTYMVNAKKSSVTDTARDLEKFSLDAADDFEKSPWSQIVPGASLAE